MTDGFRVWKCVWLPFFSPAAGEGGGTCGWIATAALTGWFCITVTIPKWKKGKKSTREQKYTVIHCTKMCFAGFIFEIHFDSTGTGRFAIFKAEMSGENNLSKLRLQ